MYESEILDVYRKCNIREFPIDCEKIVKRIGFALKKYGEVFKNHDDYVFFCSCSNDAFMNLRNMTIYYNEKNHPRRIRFSLMHEIGHYVLRTKNEDVADSFSANILAPPAIILHRKLKNADEISRYFGTSISAANNAVRSVKGYDMSDGADLISYFRAFSHETDFGSVPIIQKKTNHKKCTRRRKLLEEREAWMLENVPSFQSLAFISRDMDAFYPLG